MKLLVTQTWRDVIIAARLPPTVSSLLESSLTNLEGNLIPAPQGHSRGIGCDSGSDCSCSSNLASHLPNCFLTSLLVCLVAFMCKGIFMYQGCLWCDAGRLGVCLAVVSIELEEAEAPCAVMCNMSHSPGHSQVIQYLTLCKQAWPKRCHIRESGEGDILFSDYVQGQMAGFKGKTNEVGCRASC